MDRQCVDTPAAAPALAALNAVSLVESAVLLHSGRPHPRWARRSVLARPAAWFRYTADRRCELVNIDHSPHPFAAHLTGHLWADLRRLLACPDFPGRWYGYFSYDLARLIEPTKLAPRMDAGAWPLVELAYCPDAAEFPADPQAGTDAPRNPGLPPFTTTTLRSNFTRSQYEQAVRRVLDYIAAGDAFQVNLAQTFTADFTGDPRKLYERLAAVSPAWYGAYLELPGVRNAECGVRSDRVILSTSPELFLELRGRTVVTRPIKGTRPASTDARELLNSEKDAAELNMIVDLMRNDLGKVCSYRTVQVTQPRTIETHPTVHHGVATLTGELHESKDIVDLLRATLPGGSITGAPKVRAMQIIDELEPGPRGPYCGAIGYVSSDEACLSIAIRTMLLTRNAELGTRNDWKARFSVGGGIVADSTPASEYDETLTKARAMLDALGLSPSEIFNFQFSINNP